MRTLDGGHAVTDTPFVADQPTQRWRRPLAAAALLLTVASIAMGAFVLIGAAYSGEQREAFAPSILVAASFAVVGGLIASRRPTHLIGWLLLFIASTQSLEQFAGAYADLAYQAHARLPAADVLAWLAVWLWIPGLSSMVTFLFLLFPDGRLVGPRWRWVATASATTMAVVIAAIAISSWPLRGPQLRESGELPPGSIAEMVFGPAVLVLGACAVASISSLVVRYRRASGNERHQLKWLAYAAAIFVPLAGLDFLSLQGAAAVAAVAAESIGVIFIATAIGIAVFRYRLYDIDVVISRTLVYGALAAFITAVYVAIVVGVGTLAGRGGQPNLVLSIVATAVVAVGFQPVRERLQKLANRLVYGTRATPYEVLSEFSERVAETYAADEALPRMAKVLAGGTGAQRAEVWLRGGDTLRAAACWPAQANGRPQLPVTGQLLPHIPDSDRAVPVRHQGELLGALTVTKRRGESLTPVEDKLLVDLAAQAGLVLKNVGLTADLLARLDDLRASRQRLVAAQDEERRKLERNLHDGAQQNLVALKVKLGLAELLADSDPQRAKALLAELKAATDETLDTVRDLARGIYPPFLADKGLAAAIADHARKATLPVEVHAEGVRRYPQEIEAAVYFCALEALQNIQKYAHASHATVRLTEHDGALTFEVTDNGKGFDRATTQHGTGITNMADRIDALGGNIHLDAKPGTGTTLRGTIPVRDA